MSASATGDHPPASFPQKVVTSCGDIAELTYDSLDEGNRTSQAIDIVRRDDAGAVAVFLGTTRDNFEVFVLDDVAPSMFSSSSTMLADAYTPLAMKTLSQILDESHSLHSSSGSHASTSVPASHAFTNEPKQILKSIVIHRLGAVPVGQTSILIAVSSPHRREAFETCEWLLERVKKDVQVWKREWYAAPSETPAEQGRELGPIVAKDGETDRTTGEIYPEAMWKRNC